MIEHDGAALSRIIMILRHIIVRVFIGVGVLSVAEDALAQKPLASVSGTKRAQVVRVADGSIRVDGSLAERDWDLAPAVFDFVQKEPTEGAEPAGRMEVRFVYDSDALFVGARMWRPKSVLLQAPLSRRDDPAQAEHIIVSLDTHLDRLTAYSFGVTASGVRIDRYHPRDDEEAFDIGFDPVWEASTTVTDWGWSAELWIPFSQLRFSSASTHVWGLNIHRFVPALNEKSYWVPVPRVVNAWASRFGELHGLEGLRPSRRLELLPYVAASSTISSGVVAEGPFGNAVGLTRRAGVDMKMGLGSSLTLEVTVNPDFGQVEADSAEVNLTAFETIFPEKRQFFMEGARLLNLDVQTQLFHSRRIGQRPVAPASGTFVDYPDSTTILSAAKLTGRTTSGMSLGFLGAVTQEESARIADREGTITDVRVAPRTTYGVARIQQEFGQAGSTVSMMATTVHRLMADHEPLAQYLARRAVTGGADAILRLSDGEYEVRLGAFATHVAGEAAAIERLQRSAVHFLQRPDRVRSRLDSTRTSMPGYRAEAGIVRRSGRHWLWDTNAVFESPGMEPNDIGRTSNTDNMINNTNIRYRETRPGRVFHSYVATLTTRYEMNYDRDIVGRWLRPAMTATFLNFWTMSASYTKQLRGLDPALTRGGPLMQRPAGWIASASLGSPSANRTRWSTSVTFTGNEDGGRAQRASTSWSFHLGPRWRLSIDPAYDRTISDQQYVAAFDRPDFGRYVFAFVDRTTISSEIRAGFTLKPNLNLDVYAEPFASSGRYDRFGELVQPKSRRRMLYGGPGTTVISAPNGDRLITTPDGSVNISNRDFRVHSMRSNVVLRWEWRPGSTLYVVWQQDRFSQTASGNAVSAGDLVRALSLPGRNVLALKTSFWLPAR
jgi:hypothetical protein